MKTLTRRQPASETPMQAGKGRSSKRATSITALLPLVIFLLVFAIYPLVELIRLSFTKTLVREGAFVSEWNGLSNYKTALTDTPARSSATITIVFVLLTVLTTVVAGIFLAVLVDRSVWFMALARNILVWPAVIAPVVVSVLWLLILDPTVGAINKFLLNLNLPTQSWLNTGKSAFASIVVVDVWHWTPVVFLFMYTALKGISGEVLEAARVDGAKERQILFRIILPILTPAIAAVTLLRIIMSIKAFDEMYLLTRGGPNGATNLLTLHIRNIFFDRLDFGYASSLSMTVVTIMVVFVGGYALILRRGQKSR